MVRPQEVLDEDTTSRFRAFEVPSAVTHTYFRRPRNKGRPTCDGLEMRANG